MKQIISLALMLAALTACDDPKAARRALEDAGFTDIETLGASLYGCGQNDNFNTRFRAKNIRGKTIEGVVCSGWFKGSTIRFD